MSQRDSSPVYYREIQKHAYLKRMPDEGSGKLRPLTLKKAPLKRMWTQLCVHNGRTPYLEQYQDPVATRAHRPAWRASLATARHVTASVTPRDTEYDFLIDTHQGPVRMLAPTREDMQDWVSTLRNKLHELRILPLCENVYMSPPAPPAPPAPRAAARDPTSPLPPTPPLPVDRVPGIDLASVIRAPAIPETPEPPPTPEPPSTTLEPPSTTHEPHTTTHEPPTTTHEPPLDTPIDISNWDELSLPSTSQAPTSVAKICGQNICLDDSIFKRGGDSDEEFTDCESEGSYRQTVLVEHTKEAEDLPSERPSNITVIRVSNKEAPHTAIPVIGTETDIFNFELKATKAPDFVNIVNTENVQNDYGTVFNDSESDYGHLSLTTTVSLTGDVTVKANEDLYERLCMASTKPSPLPVRRLRSIEKVRKSSLPNLDTVNSTYEYLFLSQNNNSTISNTEIYDNASRTATQNEQVSRSTPISAQSTPVSTQSTQAPTNITSISTNSTTSVTITNTSNVTSTEINSNRHINSVAIIDSNSSSLRSNIERTHSQNAYDSSPRRERRVNEGPKTNGKVEKSEPQHKPIWKRGLTELSLLTRLRGIGHSRRPESPVRNPDTSDRNGLTSPIKVVHRSRPETRVDTSRRRSSSLSNGQSPPAASIPTALQPLRARQAAALTAAQRRGAAMVACVSPADPPVFADYNKQVWVAWWGAGGVRSAGRAGDRVCGLRASAPRDAAHARQLLHATHAHGVDILFHRVPLAKIYVITKRDQEHIGIKLDSECNIVRVESDSPAGRAGLPPAGRWAVTEVNNRHLNLIKGGEDDMNRISLNGTETSVLIQPSALVKKLRAAIKGNKTLLGLR